VPEFNEVVQENHPIHIRPAVVLKVLLALHFVTFAVYLVGRWVFFTRPLGPVSGHIVRLTDMGGEPTIPTWIAVVQLLSASAILIAIAACVRVAGDRWWRYWLALAVVFLYISLDEQAEIHEIFVFPLQAAFGITAGPFLLAWVVPALGLLVILTVAYIPFFRALPASTFRRFLIAALVYVIGAAGMEMVDAATYAQLLTLGETGTVIKALIYGVEELFEAVGVSIFIYALLIHLRDYVPNVKAFELSR
jgi:hypothetical protein